MDGAVKTKRCVFWKWALLFVVFTASRVYGQYLGVTCGWQYSGSSQLSGPVLNSNQFSISLYNPQSSNPNATWDNWAEQLDHAGVDYVCPNLTGSQPNSSGSPTNMAPLLTALINRGLTNRIKFAIFDDNAASWTAQWNQANGRGFGYAQKFDMSDTNNWKYIYDYNYKLFYQTIPDQYRFKINGRPLIIIWTGNTVTFMTNMQGNASQALMYVRQKCQADFGFNPFIVLSSDFFSNDTTCNNAGVADGSEGWFVGVPDVNYKNSYSLTTKNGTKVGVAVAEFQHTGQGGFLDPNHGVRFEVGLSNTVDANALLTLCEGFTDYEEDAAMWRARNMDTNGNALSYSQTLYDYPNQRLNILRKHSNWPFPPELKFEAEACDTFGGAAGGNGKTNFYRNGNIAIETNSDIGGGVSYDVGWTQPGEWFEWQEVPMQGSRVHLQVRVASPTSNGQMHFVVDGTNYPLLMVPNTGSLQTWATLDSGPYSFAMNGRHTIRLVCDTGAFSVNYWQYRTEIPIGMNFNLKSTANNSWVSVSPANFNLIASAASPGPAELFTLVDASAGYGYGHVALQAVANGMFVTAYTNSPTSLTADAASVGASQIFRWTDNGDGTVTLRTLANSKLVSAAVANPSLIVTNIRSTASAVTFALTPVSTNSLSFVAPPNDAMMGTAITSGALGEVQVLALDASSAPVSGAIVTLSIASGTGTITGNSAITDAGGIAHFSNLRIDKSGPKTLQTSSSALAPAISGSFNITPGAASSLTVETQADGSGSVVPAQNITAGSPVNFYAVTRDSAGNYITNVVASWSLANITGGVVTGDLVASGDGRSATLTGHTVGSAIVRATSGFAGQSGVQTVVGGAPANLVISQQPSANAQVGGPFAQQPIVTETDAFGNPTSFPITVTETGGVGNINRNPAGIIVTPVNGLATFSGLYLTNTGLNSLTFTAGAASVQSANISVGIGNAEQLAWTIQPNKATNGLVFGVSPVIQTADAGGNISALGLPAVKYISISISSGSGTLSGTVVTNIGTAGGNGTVTVTNLSIDQAGTFQLMVQDIGNQYNPTNISAAASCQLWLDAADRNSIILSGSTLSRWNDKSGRTNNAVGTASVVTNSLLSLASAGHGQAVHFNGSQELLMNLNSLSNSPYTILVMEVGAAKGGGNSYFIGNNGGFNTDLTLGIGYQTATQFRWQQYADDLNYNASLTTVTPRQWTMNLDGTFTKRLYLDATAVGTAAGTGFLKGPNLVNGTVGYNNYVGDIAEIIVYNASLSIADQTNLQNYLSSKWLTGLAPAITDPFVVGAAVYNPSFNSITPVYADVSLTGVIMSGSGGPTNGTYRVLTSTNVYAPMDSWSPVLTNSFDFAGDFSFTIQVTPGIPAVFYRVAMP
jgi:hypothetical protein